MLELGIDVVVKGLEVVAVVVFAGEPCGSEHGTVVVLDVFVVVQGVSEHAVVVVVVIVDDVVVVVASVLFLVGTDGVIFFNPGVVWHPH